MSETVSFSRLSLLLTNHLVENKQRYLLYAFGMFVIGLIIFILIFSVDNFRPDYYILENGVITNPDDTTDWEMIQYVVYYTGLYIFGGIFACMSFVNFSNNPEAIFYLNKPASQIEKWLVEITVRVLLFFIAYTIVFYVIDIPATLLAKNIEYMNHIENKYTYSDNLIREFHASRIFIFALPKIEVIVYVLMASCYISIIAYFMYGAVLFNRFSFFKTLFLAFVIGMIYSFYGLLVVNNDFIMPENWNYNFPDSANKYNGDYGFKSTIDSDSIKWISYFLLLFIPAFLLISSYFKLKEKEV